MPIVFHNSNDFTVSTQMTPFTLEHWTLAVPVFLVTENNKIFS